MDNNIDRTPLSMESDVLTNLRLQVDRLLKATLLRMQQIHCEKAKMGIALELELKEVVIDDGQGGMREAVVPNIRHKVKTQIQMQEETKGTSGMGYELVWDNDWKEYYRKPIPRNQTSLFDDDRSTSDLLEDDGLDFDEDDALPFEDDETA